jgi:hypothetical protein
MSALSGGAARGLARLFELTFVHVRPVLKTGSMSTEQKVVVITGASQEIGAGVVKGFVDGARVLQA